LFDGYHVSISLPVKIYISLHKLYPDVAKKTFTATFVAVNFTRFGY